jgi:hypothetical protein
LVLVGWSASASAADLSQESLAVPGEPLTLSGAWDAIDQRALLVRGALGGETCHPALSGFCLDVDAPSILRTFGGTALQYDFDLVVPETVPVGASTGFQVALPGTSQPVSNLVTVTIVEGLSSFGVWESVSSFGTTAFEIDNQTITTSGSFGASLYHVRSYNSAAERVIARNDDDNGFGAGGWSAFDFLSLKGELWYCQSGYDELTPADAENLPPADPSDPSVGGCGGFFSWSRLDPVRPGVAGEYIDGFGSTQSISATEWTTGGSSSFRISRYSNLEGVIIAQNAATNSFAPGAWSRFEWVELATGTYYCQSEYDVPTEYAARNGFASDRSTPGFSGCGSFGFPWTLMTPN